MVPRISLFINSYIVDLKRQNRLKETRLALFQSSGTFPNWYDASSTIFLVELEMFGIHGVTRTQFSVMHSSLMH